MSKIIANFLEIKQMDDYLDGEISKDDLVGKDEAALDETEKAILPQISSKDKWESAASKELGSS